MDGLLAYSYGITDLEVEVDLHGDEPLEERPHPLRGVVPLWVVDCLFRHSIIWIHAYVNPIMSK